VPLNSRSQRLRNQTVQKKPEESKKERNQTAQKTPEQPKKATPQNSDLKYFQ
jgi:hypothetical protein